MRAGGGDEGFEGEEAGCVLAVELDEGGAGSRAVNAARQRSTSFHVGGIARARSRRRMWWPGASVPAWRIAAARERWLVCWATTIADRGPTRRGWTRDQGAGGVGDGLAPRAAKELPERGKEAPDEALGGDPAVLLGGLVDLARRARADGLSPVGGEALAWVGRRRDPAGDSRTSSLRR